MISFNPWYVGGGVKRIRSASPRSDHRPVSILGMLEGVLKGERASIIQKIQRVSILGMLEGVLKAKCL